jgi:enoyl-CoA hydratase/carnithine racemase
MTEVTVTLSSDQALVLFELLDRWEDSDAIDTVLLRGEQEALWALSGCLERILAEPLTTNYRQLVEQARQRLAP